MVGTNSVKLMRSRAMVFKHRFRIETLQHVHGAAAHQRRQHLGAGDMADRRHREIAWRIGNFEVGQDRVGEAAMLRDGCVARPWIFRWCRRCSSVSRYRRGRRNQRGVAVPPGYDRGQQIDAVAGGAEREDRSQVGCPARRDHRRDPGTHRRQSTRTSAFEILDLEQLIVERAQGMQPGDCRACANCAATPAHQVSARLAVRNATRVPGSSPSCMNTCWMRPISSVAPAIGERSTRPAERHPRRIARQRPQRLRAGGRKGIERIGHVSSGGLSYVLSWLCLGPSAVPMLPNASTPRPGRGTTNAIQPGKPHLEFRRPAGALSRPPQPAADRGADVSRLRRRPRGGGMPQRGDRRVPDRELPQPRTAR